MQRINMAIARGGATSTLRMVDYADPSSWEFSGFSQNGEDGIIDVLTRFIKSPNNYFIEIGASDALENNTSWLAIARRFKGIWVEGDKATSDYCTYLFANLNYGVECINLFTTKDNIANIANRSLYKKPDVFSLDIDGNDYYVAEAILTFGLRPKVFVVEYNSAFGPNASVTIPYQEDFQINRAYGHNLYYGCSISAWKKLFSKFEYSFVTVDTNGVNAVFIDTVEFDIDFVKNIRGKNFLENFAQQSEYRFPWAEQFKLIYEKKLVQIT